MIRRWRTLFHPEAVDQLRPPTTGEAAARGYSAKITNSEGATYGRSSGAVALVIGSLVHMCLALHYKYKLDLIQTLEEILAQPMLPRSLQPTLE